MLPCRVEFLVSVFSFPNVRKLFKSVERIFSVALGYDLRDEKVHVRLEAEEIWVYSLGELKINATSLPFPAFPFAIDSVLQPAICLTL